MTSSPAQCSFESLPRNIITTSIFPLVSSVDWLHFRAVSRGCHRIVHGFAGSDHSACGDEESERLWRLALTKDYGFGRPGEEDIALQSIRLPAESRRQAFLSTEDIFTAPDYFTSWKHWRKVDLKLHHSSPRGMNIPPSERVNGPYFLRAGSMWKKIERWLDDDGRSGVLGGEVKASLSPGRTVDPNMNGHLREANTSALKAIYAFYAGQCDPMMDAPADQPRRYNPFTGIFGGFQAYNVISSTRWMEPEFEDNQSSVMIAQSNEKAFVMALASGQVYFITASRNNGPLKTIPATPVGANHSPWDRDGTEDSILKWFEEHATRLDRNHYSAGSILGSQFPGGENPPALLRYPCLTDTVNCSRAVTRGVEVLASAIHVPEMEMFVYSIRMRLLAPEDGEGYIPPDQRGFETCQLVSRHWRVGKLRPDSEEPHIEEVRGAGVIGFYPLLEEGWYTNYDNDHTSRPQRAQGYFSYQSCTEANCQGFMEGSLQFRAGGLTEPQGEVFDVQVARFPLNFAHYLY